MDGTDLLVAFTIAFPLGRLNRAARPLLANVAPLDCPSLTRSRRTSGFRTSSIPCRIANATAAMSFRSAADGSLVEAVTRELAL